MRVDVVGAFLAIAGNGRGAAARVRRWSAVGLALAAVVALCGGGIWLHSAPQRVNVADVETGAAPRPATSSTPSKRYPYDIIGHLLPADAVVVQESLDRRWIYVPLVSERPGAADSPSIYVRDVEGASFQPDQGQTSHVGRLHGFTPAVRNAFAWQHRPLPKGALYLERDASYVAQAAAGTALMRFALVGGLVSLLAFAMAFRVTARAA